MSYTFRLGGIEMPTPAKMTLKIKGDNKTLTLLNEGEINILRAPGLTEITVPLEFPMLGGAHAPDYYLDLLKRMKTEKQVTRLVLTRVSPDGRQLYDTNMPVTLEDYTIKEDAKEGLDVSVDANFKLWRDYSTQTVTVEEPAASTSAAQPQTVAVEKERDASTAPAAKTHTVVKGDTLWALAAKYYGSGAQYTKIYEANTDKLSNPNSIRVGQVLTIP